MNDEKNPQFIECQKKFNVSISIKDDSMIIRGTDDKLDVNFLNCFTMMSKDLRLKLQRINFGLFYSDEISSDFFNLFPNIRSISFFKCIIKTFTEDSLNSLSKLESFLCKGVKLENIPERIFWENSKLIDINLASNNLKELPALLLSKNLELANFYAFENSLSFLSKNFFDNQHKLVDVSMSMNFGRSMEEIKSQLNEVAEQGGLESAESISEMAKSLTRESASYFSTFESPNEIQYLKALIKEFGR